MKEYLNSGKDKELNLPYSPMALGLEYKGVTITDPAHWYWCVSPIEDTQGPVHLYCSRWPLGGGLEYWRTRCEIAHFVGDSPEGPFAFADVVLDNARLPEPEWQVSPHNPHIAKLDGTYVLTYIVQDIRQERGYGTSIGQMTAPSPDGPWSFVSDNGIVLRPSENPKDWYYRGVTGVDNPAFMKYNEKYWLFFKSGMAHDGSMHYGYAVSDSLGEPYVVCGEPKMDNISYVEDAACLEYGGGAYLLTTDNFGRNSGIFGAGILWRMEDGFFSLKNARIAYGVLSDYTALSGETTYVSDDHSGKLERPGILMQNGKPAYLYGCTRASVCGTGKSESYIFKIHEF